MLEFLPSTIFWQVAHLADYKNKLEKPLPPPTCRVTIVPVKTKRRAWVVAGVVVVLLLTTLLAATTYEYLCYEDVSYDQSVAASNLVIKKLRWSWLPLVDYIFEKNPCGQCSSSRHSECKGTYLVFPEVNIVTVFRDPPSVKHRCTCSDPSHKDKP